MFAFGIDNPEKDYMKSLACAFEGQYVDTTPNIN